MLNFDQITIATAVKDPNQDIRTPQQKEADSIQARLKALESKKDIPVIKTTSSFGRVTYQSGTNYNGAVYPTTPDQWAGIIATIPTNKVGLAKVQKVLLEYLVDWELGNPGGLVPFGSSFNIPCYLTVSLYVPNNFLLEAQTGGALGSQKFFPWFCSYVGDITYNNTFNLMSFNQINQVFDLTKTIPARSNDNFSFDPTKITQEQLKFLLDNGANFYFTVCGNGSALTGPQITWTNSQLSTVFKFVIDFKLSTYATLASL
jgi:hypothetical protein